MLIQSKKMSNCKGMSSFSITLYLCFIAALLTFTFVPGNFKDKQISEQFLKEGAGQLDEALNIYYGSHSGVYPNQLSDLMTLGNIPNNFSVGPYTYTVNSDFTLYKITVDLPDGTVYKSPDSKM